MKKQSNFTAMIFIAALATGPFAMADDAAPVTPDVSICETTPEVPTPVVVDLGDAGAKDVDITTVDGPTDIGSGVPIDWVKRGEGDGDPSVMYMTGAPMPSGPAPLLEKGETSRELGQDDKAAAIETNATAAAPAILSEKKDPVALIKEGRVFLR